MRGFLRKSKTSTARLQPFGFPDPFDSAMDALREELAATYGMTAAEYEALEYEIADRLFPNTAWDVTL